ncbi:MAG TPA: hypothetical protein VFE98_03035 [Candidatus Bathyarchaeia archaeon]|nr:hypothetical protein [Candidatus Bathyarchaeia archaeon]
MVRRSILVDNIVMLGSSGILGITAITIAGTLTGHDGILINSAFSAIATIMNLTILQLVRKHTNIHHGKGRGRG